MRREALQIDGGRGDDELEVWPTRQEASKVPQQEVDIEATLVGLVDDQAIVGAKLRVPLRFRQKNPVGHELDAGVLAHDVVKARLEPHRFPEGHGELLGEAPGHGARGEAPGLGMTNAPGNP